MMREKQVLCIVFRRSNFDIEYLLLKRIQEKGGFWQPVSGGMEEYDESLLDAAYRELKEEAFISRKDILNVYENIHSFEIKEDYLTNDPISTIREYAFGFEVKPDVKISIGHNVYVEHIEFKWVTYEEAMDLLKWDNNKDSLRKLQDILRKRYI